MSDFSLSDQTFALPSAGPVSLLHLPELAPESTDVQAHEVTFRHLRTANDISRIVHLRDEIRLPSAARADEAFGTREKKETRWAWLAPSCASVRT